MFRYFIYILSLALILIIYSCKNNSNSEEHPNYNDYKRSLEKVNTMLLKKDADRIEKYCKRREWEMEISKTGLYYNIYERGNGDSTATEKIVTFNYDVSLLDGTLCYTSDSLGPKTFMLGYGRVELGLEQGLLLMKEGDKARFIMPPHLAHGLIGDENRIPPRSIIVYNVELIDVK